MNVNQLYKKLCNPVFSSKDWSTLVSGVTEI